MDRKSLKLETKSLSSKEIETNLDDLETPTMPLSASLKRANRKFTSLSISVKKSKFVPKKKFLLEEKFEILEVLGAGAYS